MMRTAMRAHVQTFSILILLLAGMRGASQTIDQTMWVTDGPVKAIALDSSTIYLGGSFSYVGPPLAHSIAINAVSGAVVAGFPSANGSVFAAVADGAGGWYIGGEFSAVGGVTRNRLAHIRSDNSVAPWDPGANGTVQALAFDGTAVYAGGFFGSLGSQQRSFIGAINATTAAITNWNPGSTGPVFAMELVGTTLYVGGSFDALGGQQRGNIAAVTTAGVVTGFNPGATGTVYALVHGSGVLYLGGQFTALLGGQIPRFRLAAVEAATGFVASWNPGSDGTVFALGMSGSSVYIGGLFANIADTPRQNLAVVDASGVLTNWNPGANGQVLAMTISGTTVYVGGDFTTIAGQQRRYLAAINNTGAPTAWNPGASRVVYALKNAGGNVFAGGDFGSVGGVIRNNVAALNAATGAATAWNPLADGPVDALLINGTTVYAGGSFTLIGGQQRNRIASLSTINGQATPWNPGADGEVQALALSGTTLYAGGRFTQLGGQVRNRIAAVNTTTGTVSAWNPNANNSVLDVEVDGTTVYVAGFFTTIGSQTRNGIAAISSATGTPTTWNPNASGPVHDLAINGNLVYAGGEFLTIGGQQRNNLAALNLGTGTATAWNPSVNGAVYTVRPAGSLVYIGGMFQTVGTEQRSSFASILASNGTVNPWDPSLAGGFGDFPQANAVVTYENSVHIGGDFTGALNAARHFFMSFTDPLLVPVFGVSPVSLNLGNVPVGGLSTDSVVVSNTGVATLQFEGVFSTSTGFSVAPISGSVPPGSSRTFTVTFAPASPGVTTGNIVFVHNAATSPDSIAVSGVGTASGFSVTPAVINFSNVPVSSSKNDSVTVTNTGTSPLTISSVTSTQAEFAVSPLNATIPASGTRRFIITFSPVSAGVKSGEVIFAHNASPVPDTVRVSGAGVIPGFNVSPTSLNFGGVPIDSSRLDSLTVTNSGGAALTVSSVTSSHPDFSVIPSNASVPPSGSTKFFVTFRPVAGGFRSGSIRFVHSAPGSPDSVAVSGTGLLPGVAFSVEQVFFDDIEVGAAQNQSFDVINTGGAPLRIDSLRLRSSQQTDFGIVGSAGPLAPVPSQGSATVTLRFAPLVEGEQSAKLVVYSNAATSPDSLDVYGYAIRPFVQVSIGGDTLVGGTANLTVSPPPGFQPTNVSLLFRKGGEAEYDSVAMTPQGANFVGSVPSGVLTIRGVEYYVKIIDLEFGIVTFPSVDPTNNPAILRVRFSSITAPLTLPRRKYSVVSVPAELSDQRIASVFEDDYGPYAPNLWRVFRRQGEFDVEHPAISSPVVPGAGFWLITHTGQAFDVDNGRSVSSATPVAVTVQPGWNQIANPFAFPISWQSVVKGGRIQGIHSFDGVQFRLDTAGVLEPWQGYYVFNEESFATTLTFPSRQTRGTPLVPPDGSSPYQLRIELRSQDGGLADLQNVIGFDPLASAGRDEMDYFKPPPIGDFVSAAIMENGEAFMRNFKPMDGGGQYWDLVLTGSPGVGNVTLTLSGVGYIPPGFDVYVFDVSEGRTLGTGEGAYRLSLAETAVLRIVVGTAEYASDHSGGLPLAPLAFALEQNYPNPFNPATTIRYQLSKQGDTRLEVYTMLGQRVRTLVDAMQNSGTYLIEWDGRDGNGAVVSSGVYFIRLQSGGYLDTKKTLFLR